MQADGSPTGSGQQIDGNLIALQMIQATNSAAEAAQAAVKAVESFKSGSDDKNWYRLLPQPGDFNPSSREDEISKWREWSWQFEQYLGSLDHPYVSDIVDSRKNPTAVVDDSVQSSEEQKRSIFMYGLMAALLKGRPLLMLKAMKNFNGNEGYRQLVLSNEPKSQNRSMSLLNVIMTWPQFSPKTSMISQVMKLESAFMEYEKLGDPVPETIRAAVLLLKPWMQLQLGESTKCSDIREGVLSYERSTTKWSKSMVLGGVPDTSAPMEVDRLQWNSKGKEKGKGILINLAKAPKEKVSIQKAKMEKERIRARKEEVSLDRKESQTMPPKARIRLVVVLASLAKLLERTILSLVSTVANQATKQTCWRPKQVRSLEQDNASSVGAGSNQQGASSANGSLYAASSSATYVNQQAQQSSASSSQNVRRIAIGEDSDVFRFDLGTNVTFPDAAVRGVTEFSSTIVASLKSFSLEIQIQMRM